MRIGFVMPGSTNTVEQTVVAAERDQMLPAEVLSGNLVIETHFYDRERLLATAHVRVFYDR